MEFRDLDLSLKVHPIKKDLNVLKNNDAVISALKNLIKTINMERGFESRFGTIINNLLFEPISPSTSISIQKSLEAAIVSFEPRVNLRDILVTPDHDRGGYVITIVYYLVNSDDLQTAKTFLERLR